MLVCNVIRVHGLPVRSVSPLIQCILMKPAASPGSGEDAFPHLRHVNMFAFPSCFPAPVSMVT